MTGTTQPSLAIFSAPFYPMVGGMERYAEDLAGGLTVLGYRVELVTSTPANGADDSRFNFTVTRVSSRWEFMKILLRHKRVLFVGMSSYEVLLASVMRRSILLTHHGPYVVYGNANGHLKGAVKRRIAQCFPGICVSHYLAGWFQHRHPVIHNAYRDDLFAAAPAASRAAGSFAFVGRLVSEKGVGVLVRSFARLHARHPDVRLTIVGDGPEREALVALAQELGCREAVTFMGSQPAEAIAALLATQCCLVAPSLGFESFGIVALEGLAAGCEVVVSQRGGMSEAVGDYGWVVEPEEDALYAAMCAIQTGLGRCNDPGVAQFLRHHSRVEVARQYAEALAHLLS